MSHSGQSPSTGGKGLQQDSSVASDRSVDAEGEAAKMEEIEEDANEAVDTGSEAGGSPSMSGTMGSSGVGSPVKARGSPGSPRISEGGSSKSNAEDEKGGTAKDTAWEENVLKTKASLACYSAVAKFFKERLYFSIMELAAELGKNQSDTASYLEKVKMWNVEIITTKEGSMLGTIEVWYSHADSNKVHRTALDVGVSIGLRPPYRTYKVLSPNQCYQLAREICERLKMSQLLGVAESQMGSRVDQFSSKGDEISAFRYSKSDYEEWHDESGGESSEEASSSSSSAPRPADTQVVTTGDPNYLFAFGTTTVIEWGKILPEASAFHTSRALYPLGFKCVRLELDCELNRVVECVCEIRAESDNVTMYSVPVFRITVSWVVGPDEDKQVVVRVYEGSTPQQAWQAAMVETSVGLSAGQGGASSSNANAGMDSMYSTVPESEKAAIEEQLRKEVRERRKQYFQDVQEEQGKGGDSKPALKTRLQLSEVDHFGEPLIVRMIEGMTGAVDCRNYIFAAIRESSTIRITDVMWTFNRQHVKACQVIKAVSGPKVPSKRSSTSGVGGADNKRRKKGDDVVAGEGKSANLPKPGTVEYAKAHGATMPAAPPLPPGMSPAQAAEAAARNAASNQAKSAVQAQIALADERRARLRDIERAIKTHRDNFFTRTIKKRQQDAKGIISTLVSEETKVIKAKLEEGGMLAGGSSTGQGSSSGANERPCSVDWSVGMHGEVFSQALEIWEFLSTFSAHLHLAEIPSLDAFCQMLRMADDSYAAIIDQAPVARMTRADATRQLNKLGALLCEFLIPEYERIMGIELEKTGLGAVLNTLTWQDIARTVLVYNVSKESGHSEADSTVNLRGKGYANTPDHPEKKLLGLIRKRIVFRYGIRHEYQESLSGFDQGIVARLSNPSVPSLPVGLHWRVLVVELVSVNPESNAWLVYALIKRAASVVDGTNKKQCDVVRAALSQELKKEALDLDDARDAKRAAIALLVSHNTGADASMSDLISCGTEVASTYSSADGNFNESLLKAVSMHRDMVTGIAECFLAKANTTAFSMLEGQKDLYKCSFGKTLLVDLDDGGRVGRGGVGMPPAETKAKRKAEAAAAGEEEDGEGEGDGDDDGGDGDEDSGDDESVASEDPEMAPKKEPGDEEYNPNAGLNHKNRTRNNRKQPWRTKKDFHNEIDMQDMEKLDGLTVAMQRCFYLIAEMMRNPLFSGFNYPVDPLAVAHYYSHVPQPLCLYDIRRAILSGGYGSKVSGVYKDVTIMLENAQAYNPENTPIHLLAIKCTASFERAYLERVLAWDGPLASSVCCHQCRDPNPVEMSVRLVCERCDSVFHLNCVKPVLPRIPKGDWVCPFCLEQRSVEVVHPNRMAKVVHPLDTSKIGEVIGIEQTGQVLSFVVSFAGGKFKEEWGGEKVRRCSQDYQRQLQQRICEKKGVAASAYDEWRSDVEAKIAEASLTDKDKDSPKSSEVPPEARPAASFNAVTSVPTTFQELFACSRLWCPSLPSGYDIDDFDYVCRFVRGHIGYGTSNSLYPLEVAESHNMAGKKLGINNPVFEKARAAIAVLSPGAPPHIGGAYEWTVVLRALMQRVMNSGPILDAWNSLEQETISAVYALKGAVRCNVDELSAFVRPLPVAEGEEIVTKAEKEYQDYLAVEMEKERCEKEKREKDAKEKEEKERLRRLEAADGEDGEAEMDVDKTSTDTESEEAATLRSGRSRALKIEDGAEVADDGEGGAVAGGEGDDDDNASQASTVSCMILTDDEDDPYSVPPVAAAQEDSTSKKGVKNLPKTFSAIISRLDNADKLVDLGQFDEETCRTMFKPPKEQALVASASSNSLTQQSQDGSTDGNAEGSAAPDDSTSAVVFPEDELKLTLAPSYFDASVVAGVPPSSSSSGADAAAIREATRAQEMRQVFRDQLQVLLRKTYDRRQGLSLVNPQGAAFYRVSREDIEQLLWELGRYSRYKAKDDALFAQEMIEDLIRSIDMNEIIEDPASATLAVKAIERAKVSESLLKNPNEPGIGDLEKQSRVQAQRNATLQAEQARAAIRNAQVPVYQLVQSTVIRMCMPRISDALDLREWMGVWQESMRGFVSRQKELIGTTGTGAALTSASSSLPAFLAKHEKSQEGLVCAFCGNTESFLGSHFVHGQTLEEWEEDYLRNKSVRNDYERGEVPSAQSMAEDADRSIAHVRFRPIDTASGASMTISVLEPWLENCLNGFQWLPVDNDLVAKESSAATKRTMETALYRSHPPKKGSLVAHEYCMEQVCYQRVNAYEKLLSQEESALVTVISSIGRGKTRPLGYDRNGGRYWVFCGCPFLVVSSPPASFDANEVGEAIQSNRERPRSEKIDQDTYSSFMRNYFVSSGLAPDPAADASWASGAGGLHWTIIRRPRDIGLIMEWLKQSMASGDAKERQVYLLLAKLFPDAERAYREAREEAKMASKKKSPSPRKADAALAEGAEVVVANNATRMKWNATIVSKPMVIGTDVTMQQLDKGYCRGAEEGSLAYRVAFDGWGPFYEASVSADSILGEGDLTDTDATTDDVVKVEEEGEAKQLSKEEEEAQARKDELYLYTQVGPSHCNLMSYAPDPINSTNAWRVLYERAEEQEEFVLTKEELVRLDYSSCTLSNPMGVLRTMLLTIFKALPPEAFDHAEDRWGDDDNFEEAWLESVAEARNPTDLMAAVLMMEFGLKNSYRKGLGNKLMQCLPSRFLSLRRSTVGLLAMRLWVLDSSLKYDVQEEKKKDKKPKKKAPEQNIYETKYNRSYFVPDEDDIDF